VMKDPSGTMVKPYDSYPIDTRDCARWGSNSSREEGRLGRFVPKGSGMA